MRFLPALGLGQKNKNRRRSHHRLAKRRVLVERLESRRLLATFVVNSTGTAGDPYTLDGICDTTNNPSVDPPVGQSGICTLPAAVASANGSPGPDTIAFNIPGVGVPTINLGQLTLGVFDTVTIDGTTQPGGMVELQGLSNNGAIQLLLGGISSSSGSRVTGLVINNSVGGIGVLSDNNTIAGNRFGTNPAGTALMPITGTAIGISGNNNTIGGPMRQDRNIISGSLGGVSIVSTPGVSAATGNVIQGNYIGTDITGAVALGNTIAGVDISFAADNTVADNVISANGTGVSIQGDTASGNVVVGNMIGTNPLGTVTDPDGIPNNGDELGNGKGVFINDAPMNFVGGMRPGGPGIVEGNVISGSTGIGADFGFGVHITNSGATGNVVQGNKIGTDGAGTVALPNVSDGVHIADAGGNTIGGDNPVNRNIISGNGGDGVFMFGNIPGNTTNNVVIGNYIGTDVTGMVALPNVSNGVTLGLNAANNTIGGNTPGERNLISGNGKSGVLIALDSARNNVVKGNFIGSDVTGGAPLGNGGDGVRIDDAPDNTIGGAEAGTSNVISSNAGDGVFIAGMDATGNLVQGNFIGTDDGGLACDRDGIPNNGDELGNGVRGVEIQDASNNSIGGLNESERNVISCNTVEGVLIVGAGARLNEVVGNLIGTAENGAGVLGNGGNGVGIVGAPDNTIGDNVISNSFDNGVLITGMQATRNVVSSNFIGTDANGVAPLGNLDDGVEINDAPNNDVVDNVISDNLFNGVLITGNQAAGNNLQLNRIGTTDNGLDPLGNSENGVQIDNAPGSTISGNVVSDNLKDGVTITGMNATGTLVFDNFIGTVDGGISGLGNGEHGVHIVGAEDNEIGGDPGAPPLNANTIAFNGGTGVFVESGIGNRIRVNSTFNNGGLGIDLNAVPGPPDGVTLNDLQPDPDSDTGANDLQNFPDFDFAMSSEGLRVFGTLNSLPGSYELLFYANTAVDPSRFGEGERFLFALNVAADANGIATFDETLPVSLSGECVTATAENLETFGTSEFSECFLGLPPIVINEVDYDQPGEDTAEFIELKNNSTSPQNLNELSIQLIDGDSGGANVYQTIDLPDVELAAGDYFVICSDANNVPNCDLVVTLGSDFIQNGAPDAVALLLGSNVLDTVSYGGDTGTPFTEGSGVGLVDDPDLGLTGISRFPDGQDTDQNNIDFSPRCITPGAMNSAETSPCLAIVEISPSGPGGAPDPDDLPSGPQPTSWMSQRSDLREIVIRLATPISAPSASDLVLTNLGVNAPVDPDVAVLLNQSHLSLSADGLQLRISFAANELSDGVYQLELTPAITGGEPVTITGDATNKFFVLTGDWNGSGGVNIQDFATFAYWFGNFVPPAPDYVDVRETGGINIQDFAGFAGNFGNSVTFPSTTASLTATEGSAEGELASALRTLVNPSDVNGDGAVTARDALNVMHEIERGGTDDDVAWSRFDANVDGRVTSADALYVINRLAGDSLVSQIAAAVSDSPREQETSDAVDRLLSDQAFMEGLF